jgi:CHAP domain
MSATSQMLAVARAQIGYREHGDNLTKYGQWYGNNGDPWCNVFVCWVFAHAGLSHAVPRGAYTPSTAGWYKKRRRWSTQPRVGAEGYVYGPDGTGTRRIHHTFLVEAVHSDGTITTIEGNTNNTGSARGIGVFRLRRRAHRSPGSSGVIGYGYPLYPAVAGGPQPARTAAPGAPPDRPVVDLSKLVDAARTDPTARQGHITYSGSRIVEAALAAEHLLDRRWVDGSFGTLTVTAYSAWQRRLGYRGADADGIPGMDSLKELGRRHRFLVVP